ncbi:ATP-dependent RNA helicase DHX8 [Cryptosporidium felis]|nr:ATP-dependent RNA helicase DHX8 [Cryptosporidium felis]
MSKPDSLPIFQYKNELVSLVKENDISVIVGETGSGKSTLLPVFLLENGFSEGGRIIAVTQPRRIAAISLAEYVARILGTRVGGKVGYSVRFRTETSRSTRIKYLTDGMLIRECVTQRDKRPFEGYSVVILDEAHERSIRTDFLLGILKMELSRGSKIKVVIMSATFQTSSFETFFESGSLGSKLKIGTYSVPGRQFPVKVFYLPQPELDYLEAVMITVMTIHFTKPKDGDILVFLPGQEDILQLYSNLTSISRRIEALYDQSGELAFHFGKLKLENIPRLRLFVQCLYASMSSEEQGKVFNSVPENYRKVILATNIAETSVTLPNIAYVVDSGLEKLKFFQSNSSIDALVTKQISKASSIQRAGRAGRLRPGEVYRIYTQSNYSEFPPTQAPEILRTSLSETLLELIYILDNFSDRHQDPNKNADSNALLSDQQQNSAKRILDFPFVSYPTKDSVLSTLKFLYRLEALNINGALTELGIKLTMLPLPPILGKLVYHSVEFGCTSEALTLVSMLSAECFLDYCGGQDDQSKLPMLPDEEPNSPLSRKKRQRYTNKSSRDLSYKSYLKSTMARFGDHAGLVEAYNTWASLQRSSPTSKDRPASFYSSRSSPEQSSFCSSVGISHISFLRAKSIREQLTDVSKKVLGLKSISSCLLGHSLSDQPSAAGPTQAPVSLPPPVLGSAPDSIPTSNPGNERDAFGQENKWTPLLKCLSKSFWQNVARLDSANNKQYLTEVTRQFVSVHPTSSVSHLKEKPRWVVFTDIIQTKKTYIRVLSAINQLWLGDYCSRWFISANTS